MAVRNFWIDADIDGRQTMLSGGPKSRDGGMRVNIYQRDEGGILHVISINCYVSADGKLISKIGVEADGQSTVSVVRTER